MELIDTHCHIEDRDDEYIKTISENAAKCNVKRFICIGSSKGLKSARLAVELADKYEHIYATVGVHPHEADNDHDLDEIRKLASHPKVVAIGETGLDYFRDWAKKENQIVLFKNQIEIAKEFNKPLVIHSRDAKDDCIQILREKEAKSVGGVFHCYAEDSKFAKEVIELNFLISFTGNITFKKAENIREAAKNTPLSKIMLETDAPYMAPEPFRGKESEPMHVYQVALKLSELHELSLEEVAEITTENAKNLFGLA